MERTFERIAEVWGQPHSSVEPASDMYANEVWAMAAEVRRRRLLACAALCCLRKKKVRKTWVKEWVKNRDLHDAYHALLTELHLGDRMQLKNFLRMTAEDFECLIQMIGPKISRQDTFMRKAISVESLVHAMLQDN